MREGARGRPQPPSPASASQRAAGSSFYTAMRILPRAQRDAMFEIYSFCRARRRHRGFDGPRGERLAELDEWRAEINALYEGRIGPKVAGLARPVREFDLAREDFLTVIDGMEMDTVDDIRAPNFATLDLYCDRVASAVGRLSVRVFGIEREAGRLLAHHLGRALQLTNILRDLDEDAAVGRLYLPREALQHAGIDTTDPATALAQPGAGEGLRPSWSSARASISPRPTRSWRAARARRCARRASWARSIARSSTAWSRAALRRRASRSASRARGSPGSCCAMR